jgi:hypothetical protein
MFKDRKLGEGNQEAMANGKTLERMIGLLSG